MRADDLIEYSDLCSVPWIPDWDHEPQPDDTEELAELRSQVATLKTRNAKLKAEHSDLLDMVENSIKIANKANATTEALQSEIADLAADIGDAKRGHAFSTYVYHEICDGRLTPTEVMVKLAVRFRGGQKGATWVSAATIGKDLGLSTSTVKRSLATLTKLGLVTSDGVRVRRAVNPVAVYGETRILELGSQTSTGRSDNDVARLRSLDLTK